MPRHPLGAAPKKEKTSLLDYAIFGEVLFLMTFGLWKGYQGQSGLEEELRQERTQPKQEEIDYTPKIDFTIETPDPEKLKPVEHHPAPRMPQEIQETLKAGEEDSEGVNLRRYLEAIVQIESGGNPDARRYEPGINDTSWGLGQILTETALGLEAEYPDLPRISDYNLKPDFSDKDVEKALVRLYGNFIWTKEKGEKTKSIVNVDGKLNEAATIEFLKRIQNKHNLHPTGEINAKTITAIQDEDHLRARLCDPTINTLYTEALYSSLLETYKDPFVAVAAYNCGPNMINTAIMQQRLNELNGNSPGYIPLTPDGSVGPNTEKVVRRFQQEHELEVDGKVGRATRRGINSAWKTMYPGQENSPPIIPENSMVQNHVRKFAKALEKQD